MTNEELVKQYQEGNEKALEELIKNNKGIISNIALKYYGIARERYIEFEDLFNTGVIGLINAASNYEPDRNVLFISLLYPYVKHEILESINGKTLKDMKNNKMNYDSISLNTAMKEYEELELIDTIKSEEDGYSNIDEKLLLANLRKELEETMNTVLTPVETDIIKLSYGWNGEELTQEGIAKRLNIPHEQEKTSRAKADKKLRYSKWAKTRGKEYKLELIGERKEYWEGLMRVHFK